MRTTPADGLLYAALGDSISIDEYAGGRGRGGASLLHADRDEDFPEWRGRDLRSVDPAVGLALLALDGATRRTPLEVQLPRPAALPPPAVVTVTIGGITGRSPGGTPWSAAGCGRRRRRACRRRR